MSQENVPGPRYHQVRMSLTGNRRNQWSYSLTASSYQRGAPKLIHNSDGLWLPSPWPVADLEDGRLLILDLLSQPQLPYA
uniref:Uncharacterized protein n=1 Tax=uncultured prokaryote TaxID=198431 RepID=A0A0H5QNI9_9ZZZZ|nr:hypothetical protein [uncultured prokaryote]